MSPKVIHAFIAAAAAAVAAAATAVADASAAASKNQSDKNCCTAITLSCIDNTCAGHRSSQMLSVLLLKMCCNLSVHVSAYTELCARCPVAAAVQSASITCRAALCRSMGEVAASDEMLERCIYGKAPFQFTLIAVLPILLTLSRPLSQKLL